MAANPLPLLAIIALYAAVWGLAAATLSPNEEVSSYGLDQAPDTVEPENGFWDVLAGIIHGVWGVVQMLVGALTFNVPGAPAFIRLPISILFIGGLSWSIATLIRGN